MKSANDRSKPGLMETLRVFHWPDWNFPREKERSALVDI
jgi:hypothetical protein